MVRVRLTTTASTIPVEARLTNLEPAFKLVGELLVREIDDNFRGERDPYGQNWAPLASSTLATKKKQKRIQKILQSRGILRGSVSYQANPNRVLVGFAAEYAKYHQGIGFTPSRKKLPIRLLLPTADRGLPPRVERAIAQIIADHLS